MTLAGAVAAPFWPFRVKCNAPPPVRKKQSFGIGSASGGAAGCASPAATGIIEKKRGRVGVGAPMVEVMLRRGRRAEAGRTAAAAGYAALGWPVCPGAHPRDHGRNLRHARIPRASGRGEGRACSCDRIGCPAPGAHPLSPAWQLEASSDPGEVTRWWQDQPDANIILVTGRVFDVLDVPVAAGTAVLAAMAGAAAPAGPVAVTGDGRALFFVTTRGAPASEDEWWSCHLDCEPGSFAPVAGLRWHCRDSYVVAPPSRCGLGGATHWVHHPHEHRLPDAVRVLEFLADACDEVMR